MQKKTFRLQLTLKVAECITCHKASLSNILFSLFQDSLGARAKQVVISTRVVDNITWLRLADDGKEIFISEESSSHINKRASKDTYFLRSPRQLSVFNLWHRGAVVESNKLSVTLAPENFPIARDVQMQSSLIERGTEISFPMLSGEITELLRVIKCLAIYSPIPLVFNGSKLQQNTRVLAQV